MRRPARRTGKSALIAGGNDSGQTAIHGIGIAVLPEQVVSTPLREGRIERVLSEWSGANNILHLVYLTPPESDLAASLAVIDTRRIG